MSDLFILNQAFVSKHYDFPVAIADCNFLEIDNFQLQKEGTFNGLQAYKNSKLCNVLFTYYLAEKLSNTRVTVNAIDPGRSGDTESGVCLCVCV